MKFNDYIRLGKINVKSRKKSTKHTVVGIAFGLIMIIPVLYLSLAFKLDLTKTINATNNISTLYVNSTKDSSVITDQYDNVINKQTLDKIINENDDLVDEYINSEYYSIEPHRYSDISFVVDNKNYVLRDDLMDKFRYGMKIKGVDIQNNDIVTNGIKEDLKKNNKELFVAGSTLNKDKKGEVLISQRLANIFTSNYDDLIDKTFTLQGFGLSSEYYIDSDNDPNNELNDPINIETEVISSFIIKGVVSEDYYHLNDMSEYEADIIINIDSIYGEKVYAPVINEVQINGRYEKVVTYLEDYKQMSKDAKDNQQMFVAIPVISYTSFSYINNVLDRPVVTTLFECNDYGDTKRMKEYIDYQYKEVFRPEDDNFYSCFVTNQFSNFMTLNMIMEITIVILSIFGGIIFFATLLNLYNSIHYSVESRRNYLGMMRAIGSDKYMIPKLYLVEIIIIFVKAIPYAIGFSLLICFGIKLSVDSMFNYGNELFGVAIKLSFSYYFVALLITLMLIFVIGLLFSFIACLPVTKDDILDLLTSDK